MNDAQWFVLNVNPYPWKVPPFSPGRKGNRIFVVAGRDAGLHAYKEAIREQMEPLHPRMIEGPVQLHLWFWRNMGEYTSWQGRKSRNQEADNTNLQKATEDAFHGLLYENDKDVHLNMSHRVAQSPDTAGFLVVCAAPFTPADPTFPDAIQWEVDELLNRHNTSEVDFGDTDKEIPF